MRGDRARHGQPRRVDYLLRYTDAFPIAVVEAKAEGEAAETGLEQAKGYARDLGVAFAYTTNGIEVLEREDLEMRVKLELENQGYSNRSKAKQE